MKTTHLLPALSLLAIALSWAGCNSKTTTTETKAMPNVAAPIAAKKPKNDSIHSYIRTDDYFWLRERENEEVLSYLRAENAYTDTMMATEKGLIKSLFEEMKARIKEDDNGVPSKNGDYYYSYEYKTGQEYPIYTRMKGKADGPRAVTFDLNEMAKDQPYFNMGEMEVSDDGKIAAFSTDTKSRRLYNLQFKDLTTGKIYPETIPNTDEAGIAWAADNKTCFYIKKDPETLLGYQVLRHTLGTDPKQDVLVYEEKDNQFYISLSRSRSGRYIALGAGQHGVASETFLIDATKPEGKFVSFLPREKGHEYQVDDAKDGFYITTNRGAKNFKVVTAPNAFPTTEKDWKEVVAHREDVQIEGVEVFEKYVVVLENKEGINNFQLIDRSNNARSYVPMEEESHSANMGANPEYNSDEFRFGYTSLTTPSSILEFDVATKKTTILKQQEVLGGFKKEDYESERLYSTSRDGAKVPISIVYKKGFNKDGKAPLLQYGYGSYGLGMSPTFSSARLSLLNRGFAFAICHIRGGDEMGRRWYEDGKLMKKMNTFNDFIDCGKFLIDQKYTSESSLFAMGGSAGGLLMGALANMAASQYKGIIAAVPFVDVVNTMMDATIPLTTNEYEEWGNPANKAAYDYMMTYSPYDNVAAQQYPNLLITTGLHDSQVQYWEPAKWTAKLRALKTDKNLLLLHTDMEAGHGGASGRFKALNDTALEWAFMLKLLGLGV